MTENVQQPQPNGNPRTIAALYVQRNGAYFNLPGVDPWDEARVARLYAGPHPAVAHPPCERWGAFATGNFRNPKSAVAGADGGCFAAALASVRTWGGVIEHPAGSKAWAAHGLLAPPRDGGWVPAGDWRGWTCCVEQGHFGHPARKPTWLYAVGCVLPDLPRGAAPESWRDDPTRSEQWKARAARDGVCVLLSSKQRAATPGPFRDMLITMARSATGVAQ
jgi:hypothetical protein